MIPEETSFHAGNNHGAIMLADDDEFDWDNVGKDNDDDDDDAYNPGDDENMHPNNNSNTRGKLQKEASLNGSSRNVVKDRRSLLKKQKKSSRRRRRSSARFLKMGDNDDTHDDVDNNSGPGLLDTCNLKEVYANAIRMNAENKINATNSWNINLIDHLDRFVEPELRSSGNVQSGGARSVSSTRRFMNGGDDTVNMDTTLDSSLMAGSSKLGVNFTKASCTLDASVKIYSYRVDDVHLTSYKVLANLNRTDTKTTKKKGNHNNADGTDGNDPTAHDEDDGSGNGGGSGTSGRTKSRGGGDTLEHNISNINIHKLDAAFDIDPLFHKMSKNFDEGGAKGLLLANLGVGTSGCKIVFDSTLDEEEKEEEDDATPADDVPQDIDAPDQTAPAPSSDKTAVDVTSLVAKLAALLISASGGNEDNSRNDANTSTYSTGGNNNSNKMTVGNIPLVPQLISLREQFHDLNTEGFVDDAVVATKKYACTEEEEVEADKSIHVEAIERSRASQADLGRSLNARDAARDSFGSYGSDDYDGGGGFDFAGTGDDDNDFGDMHDGDHRFSSSSFQAARNSQSPRNNTTDTNLFGAVTGTPNKSSRADPLQQSQRPFSQAGALLDAIASGDITTGDANNPYEYFNSQALSQLSQGNLWAGADHWKKLTTSRRRKTTVIDGDNSQDADGCKTPGKKKRKGRKKKTNDSSTENRVAILLDKPIDNLEELLKPPIAKKKGRGKKAAVVKSDPCQLTDGMLKKYGDIDNLLPLDCGLTVAALTQLYGRPKTNVIDLIKEKRAVLAAAAAKSNKVVGFGGVETWGDTDDNSFGGGGGYDDDDDGGGGMGFEFASGDNDDGDDTNEFVIPQLDDVRKINKVKIGYAKVARKVDVKRLKRDLWTELEQTFAPDKNKDEEEENTNNDDKDEDDAVSTASTVSDPDPDLVDKSNDNVTDDRNDIMTTLSFQNTVHDMQTNQSQSNITLPFYFICILHLCNEKGLALESCGLDDFIIHSPLDENDNEME